MELVHIIVDFLTLGIVGFCIIATLLIWWGFCESFIFEQGYLNRLNRHGVLKAIIIVGIGLLIWGMALVKIHYLLWG